jgi:hypothetical protein
MNYQDTFPESKRTAPNLNNLHALALLEELEHEILELKPTTNTQKWLQSKAIELTSEVVTTRWALTQQNVGFYSDALSDRVGVLANDSIGEFRPVRAAQSSGDRSPFILRIRSHGSDRTNH